MKRIAFLLALVLLLSGCGVNNDELDRGMELRARLLASQGCSFNTSITADYGDETYTFSVNCQSDTQGNVTFTVKEPETIAGITGTISAEGGKLTFDDKTLAFALLADGQVTPVSAGWLLVKALRSGYVKSCGMDGDQVRLSIADSYEKGALLLDIWLGKEDLPVRADIMYNDRRILSLQIAEFQIL